MRAPEASHDEELLALERGLAKARERASRNGLTLEVGDGPAGPAWKSTRFASVHLMRGSEQVAGCARSYHDEASKRRALSFCADQVFNRPA